MAVQVLWADVGVPRHLEGWLAGAERDRLAGFRQPLDRERFVAAHALARVAAGRWLGQHPASVVVHQRCDRCAGHHGRPRIADADLALSLTHAGGLVAVAVAHLPVGVDLEPIDLTPARLAAIADVALSIDERATLLALPEVDRAGWVVRRWTAKEAVAKALGVGLGTDPAQLDLRGHAIHELELDGTHVGSLAVPAGRPVTPSVTRFDWSDL